MNDENYWKQFMRSGRVQDYLAYAGEIRQKKEAPEESGVSNAGEEERGRIPLCRILLW